jgi:hypothetical protein
MALEADAPVGSLATVRAGGASMRSVFCPQCRQRQPAAHLYCLRCGESLPSHLLDAPPKSARFFAGVKIAPDDPETAFLRVSCYRRDQLFETEEGAVRIPGHHVRFSVWVGSEARCVVSIPESEARELVSFVGRELDPLLETAKPPGE